MLLEKQLNHAQTNLEHFRETILAQKAEEKKNTEQYNTLLNDYQNNQIKLDELQQLFNEMEKKLLLFEEKMKASEKFSNLMENRTQELLQEKTIIMKENEELKRKLKMERLFEYPEN